MEAYCENLCAVEIVQPTLPHKWLTTPLCVVIVLNLFGHYYHVCTVAPGFADDPPREAGRGFLWARKRRSAKYRALTGVRWSQDVNVTRAELSKCKRCGVMRPEVSRVQARRVGGVCARGRRGGRSTRMLRRDARGPIIAGYATAAC